MVLSVKHSVVKRKHHCTQYLFFSLSIISNIWFCLIILQLLSSARIRSVFRLLHLSMVLILYYKCQLLRNQAAHPSIISVQVVAFPLSYFIKTIFPYTVKSFKFAHVSVRILIYEDMHTAPVLVPTHKCVVIL